MDPQQTNQQENKNNAQNDQPQVQKQQEQVKLIQKEKEKCLEIKNKAGTFFNESKFEEASDLYKEALDYCPLDDLQMLCILNSNIAICYMKQQDYDSAIDYCTKALKFNPEFIKALINRAESYEKLDKFEDALEGISLKNILDYKKLKVLQIQKCFYFNQILLVYQNQIIYLKTVQPQDKVIIKKFIDLDLKVQELDEKRNFEAVKALKNRGNQSVLGKLGLNEENFKLEKNENGTYNISYKS